LQWKSRQCIRVALRLQFGNVAITLVKRYRDKFGDLAEPKATEPTSAEKRAIARNLSDSLQPIGRMSEALSPSMLRVVRHLLRYAGLANNQTSA
jgi:hypothetical protein